jgi:uncharacterized membrane protein YesL
MEMQGLMAGFHRLSIWVMRLAYVNLLWILFTLAGFIVFGFGAATIALFAIIRKLITSNDEIAIFKSFKDHYKENFLRGNLLSLFYIVVGLLLYFNIRFFGQFNVVLYEILVGFFIVIFIIHSLAICYFFPIFSHFQMKTFAYIKNSYLFPLFSPIQSILIVLGLLFCTIIFSVVPGLIPFFCVSLPAFVIFTFANRSFVILEEKQKKTTTAIDLHDE